MANLTPWIAPSILAADFARLGEEVERVVAAGADMIHFDVMDNHYVPTLTVGPLVCQALRRYGISALIDVHLMVEPVDSLIQQFMDAGANYITFHPEASRHVDRSLQLIKSAGGKAGLALNPATPLTCLEHVWQHLDMVLLMSVNPGFGGQSFLDSTYTKISKLREQIQQFEALNPQQPAIRLQVDGGVKLDNIARIAEAGADTFVAGTAIFSQPDYAHVIAKMRQLMR